MVFACRQKSDSSFISSLHREHDAYLQQFQQATDTLQKQSARIKADPAYVSDSSMLQKIEAFDKKILVYKEKYTTKLERFKQLSKKFESGEIPEQEMASYKDAYVADFKVFEDAFGQLKSYLNSLENKADKK